jgi:hypothetical protein
MLALNFGMCLSTFFIFVDVLQAIIDIKLRQVSCGMLFIAESLLFFEIKALIFLQQSINFIKSQFVLFGKYTSTLIGVVNMEEIGTSFLFMMSSKIVFGINNKSLGILKYGIFAVLKSSI